MPKKKKSKDDESGPKSFTKRVAEAGGHTNKNKAISGFELGSVDIVRMQIEGDKDGGKSTFVLSTLKHLDEVMHLKPEQILMCIIDFDKRGIGRLLKRRIIRKELQERIVYWKCEDIMDAYDAWEYMDKLLEEHVAKHGSAGAWIVIENTGAMWEFAQDYYSRAVEGLPMHELLVKKKKAAKRKGHTAFALFDNPRDSYKVINPLHNNLRNSVTNSDYNVLFTCHLKAIYGSKETGNEGEVIAYKGEGQKKNEADMDFIIRCHLNHKVGKHYKELRASKDTSLLFKKQEDMDFTEFWKWVYGIMTREAKKNDSPSPDRYWLTPINKE